MPLALDIYKVTVLVLVMVELLCSYRAVIKGSPRRPWLKTALVAAICLIALSTWRISVQGASLVYLCGLLVGPFGPPLMGAISSRRRD